MIVYPNAKINLGLNVVEKRSDGFHNIETVFFAVPWCEALEIIPAEQTLFTSSGLAVEGAQENNLIIKAYHLMKQQVHMLPEISIHLHKTIPMGAGLGGGSADAAFTLRLLNTMVESPLPDSELQNIANRLGSDCAFFLNNKPVYATEKGNVFEEIELKLAGFYLIIVWPGVHSPTALAYSKIKPKASEINCKEIVQRPLTEWKQNLVNDFEACVFEAFPQVRETKQRLYSAGAVYASMSGSGSAVFGIFEQKPKKINWPASYIHSQFQL